MTAVANDMPSEARAESPVTGIGLALDHRLRSGSYAAVPKHGGRVSLRPATAKPARGGPKDYCLLEERGECLGTIAARLGREGTKLPG